MLQFSKGAYYCFSNYMGGFFLEHFIILIAGFGVGVISHDSLKTFRLFMRIFIYVLLPSGLIRSVFGVYYNWDHYKQMEMFRDVLISEFLTKCILWSVTVLGCWLMYRNKRSIVYGAICGQFVIQGNNVGYALGLYRDSCNGTGVKNETLDTHPTLFEPLSYFTTYINFLIFIPLSHGVATLAKQKGTATMTMKKKLKLFQDAFMYEQKQILLSTTAFICFTIVVILFHICKMDTIDFKLYTSMASGFDSLSKHASLLLTLATGVYFHHLLFHLDITNISIMNTAMLTVLVSFIYPALAIAIQSAISKHELIDNFDIAMIQYSVPASPYSQHFALQHSNEPISLIVAFFASVFISPIVGLVPVIVGEAYIDGTTRTPIEYYDDSQRGCVQVFAAIFAAITMVMFAKVNQEGKKRILFFLSLNEIFNMACRIVIISGTIEDPDLARMLFAMILCTHLVCCSLTVLLLIMVAWPSFPSARGWVWLSVAAIYIIALTLSFSLAYSFMNPSYKLNMADIDYLLDFDEAGDGSDQIASITYITLNCIMMLVVVVLYVRCYRAHRWGDSRSRAFLETSTRPSSSNAHSSPGPSSTNHDVLDLPFGPHIPVSDTAPLIDPAEGHQVKNYMIYIVFQTTVVLLMTICQFRKVFDRYWISFDTIGLIGTILSDVTGLVAFLLFTISVGDMREELARYREIFKTSWVALRCRSMCRDPGISDVDPSYLPWEVIDNCRKFIQYHKEAFLYYYPATERNGRLVLRGEDLVKFLRITGVAGTTEEALHLANSYIQGHVMVPDASFIGVDTCPTHGSTLERSTYIFTPPHELIDFEQLRKEVKSPFTYFNDDII